jgi:hypothetical protein
MIVSYGLHDFKPDSVDAGKLGKACETLVGNVSRIYGVSTCEMLRDTDNHPFAVRVSVDNGDYNIVRSLNCLADEYLSKFKADITDNPDICPEPEWMNNVNMSETGTHYAVKIPVNYANMLPVSEYAGIIKTLTDLDGVIHAEMPVNRVSDSERSMWVLLFFSPSLSDTSENIPELFHNMKNIEEKVYSVILDRVRSTGKNIPQNE